MGSPNEYIETDEGYWQSLFAEDAQLHGHVKRSSQPDRRSQSRVATDPAQPHDAHTVNGDGDARDLLCKLCAGDVCSGTVTNLTAFGAFVDVGGFEGLVHVSEISWSRVAHPRDVLRIGDVVQVAVLKANPDEGRLALSLKRCKPNPWDTVTTRYTIGQIVQGPVTNVVDFGAFVKVERDLEGMIHVSEMADGSFLHPRNILREGMTVRARVIGVDGPQRRLALSLRGIDAHDTRD